MRRRVAKAALGLYPVAFRRRYGDEMLALLEDSPPGAGALLDLLRGAVVAHARPAGPAAASLSPEDRLRATSSGVLACWIAFAAAGFGFYKTTEDHPFAKAGDTHLALGGAHLAIQVLAILASLAVLVGAFPLAVAALRQARRARVVRRATGLAVGAVALFVIATAALVVLSHTARSLPSGAAGIAFAAWALVGLASGGVCAFAASRGLFATRVRRRGLVAALACGTLVTAAMALIALATAVYVAALAIDASGLAAAGNGPAGAPSVVISIGIQLTIMLTAATLAAVSTRRGWSALALAGEPHQ
jgi:hypothetical protein